MSVKDTNPISEASEIIEAFNEDEIRLLVRSQIMCDSADLVGSSVIDQFDKIYERYKGLVEEDADGFSNDDLVKDATARFMNICHIFLDLIQQKYAVTLDQNWQDMYPGQIIPATKAIYNFFVVYHASNVTEALYTYIIRHMNELYTIFENEKNRKDAATTTNRKEYSQDVAVIISNIYDVCSYVYAHGFKTYDDFFDCINPDDQYMSIVKSLFDSNVLYGVTDDSDDIVTEDTFLDRYQEIFDSNVSYKGTICFNVADRIKRHYKVLEQPEA